jgi:MFS family permease
VAVTVSSTDSQARPAPLVLLGCLLCSMVTASPIIATTVSVFIVPISKEFGWARTQFPLIILVSAVIAGVVVTPLAGRVLDRVGTKPVMIAGAVVFALANVLAAFNDGVVWHAFLIYLLIGSSASFTGMFGVNKIVSVWFSKTRGRALGVSIGLGVGLGAAMTPLLTQYFVQHSGWRSAYFALAAVILVFTIPSVLWLTPNTKGAKADLRKARERDGALVSTRQILKMRDFWLLIVLAAANGLAVGGLMGHWIPIQTGRGMSITLATLLLSSFGLLKAFAQVGGGLLLDKIQTPRVALIFFVPITLGILLIAAAPNASVVVVGAVLFGIGEGAENALLPYLVSRYFGVGRLAEIFGYVAAALIVSSSTGLVVLGKIFDVTGSYAAGLWVSTGFIVIALIATASLGAYRYRLIAQPEPIAATLAAQEAQS